MPNPSTVYAEDYDDGHVETLVAGPDGRGYRPGDGLADGLPGGESGDSVQPDLDTPAKTLDDVNYSAQLNRITQLEGECQQYEAVWKQLKADCKAAFADFDASCARLRAYIRGLAIPMPLFEGDQNDSPAGEDILVDSGDGDLLGGDEVLRIGYSPPEAGGLDGQDGGSRESGEAATPGCEEGGPGCSGLETDEEAPADADDDEGWKSTHLSGIFSPGVTKKLADAGLLTLGQLTKWREKGHEYTEIKGIGESKQIEMENSLECFWADWEKD